MSAPLFWALALTLAAILLILFFREKPLKQMRQQQVKKDRHDGMKLPAAPRIKKEITREEREAAQKAEALDRLRQLTATLQQRLQETEQEAAACAAKLAGLKRHERNYRHLHNLAILCQTERACLEKELSRAQAAGQEWAAATAVSEEDLDLLRQINRTLQDFKRLKAHEESRHAQDRHGTEVSARTSAAAPKRAGFPDAGLKLKTGLDKMVGKYALSSPHPLLGVGHDE